MLEEFKKLRRAAMSPTGDRRDHRRSLGAIVNPVVADVLRRSSAR
jgi:hypothetical protein